MTTYFTLLALVALTVGLAALLAQAIRNDGGLLRHRWQEPPRSHPPDGFDPRLWR